MPVLRANESPGRASVTSRTEGNWAATVRATTRDLGAEVVLCLNDELLVHAPAEHAAEVAARVDRALDDAARRWAGGGAPVRFVSDTSVIARWSDAKD